MKTVKFISALALSALVCVACKSNNTSTTEEPKGTDQTTENAQAAETAILDSAKAAAGVAFLEEFYKVYDGDYEEGGFNDEFIKSKITPNLKQWLIDSYDYDCDGECMASWLFCYEGGGDTGGLKVRTIKPEGDAYLVSCIHDQGQNKEYHYTIKLTLVQDGDTFKIDNLEKIDEHYVGYDE